MKEFRDKHKLDALWRFEVKMVKDAHKRIAEIGWVETDTIPLTEKIVISYPSSSRDVTDDERRLAKDVGRGVATLADYRQYFERLIGEGVDTFLEVNPSLDAFVAKSRYSEKQATFVYKLASFLKTEKRFSSYGISYKVMEPENETRDAKTAIRREGEGSDNPPG